MMITSDDLLSTRGVLDLELHRGAGQDATASGQKLSQEWREKKLFSREYGRREETGIERSHCGSIMRPVTESRRVEDKSINQKINIIETDISVSTTKKI